VPSATEIEWSIRPLLAEWAEVASYDAPGVGDEPPAARADLAALEARALAELDRLGWDRCVIAGDEWGAVVAIEAAAARPEVVAGLAFGHACLSYRQSGERAPVREEVVAAFTQLAEVDYRAFARALTQLTQQAYDDDLADEYTRRVPQEVTLAYLHATMEAAGEGMFEPLLRGLDRPLLFAKHEGCLAWTDEGFQDAVAAFPEATTTSTDQKPSVSPEFAEALREFCAGLDWG
jgi:pimeloyl-ACP methyl ester carboxylesterase